MTLYEGPGQFQICPRCQNPITSAIGCNCWQEEQMRDAQYDDPNDFYDYSDVDYDNDYDLNEDF